MLSCSHHNLRQRWVSVACILKILLFLADATAVSASVNDSLIRASELALVRSKGLYLVEASITDSLGTRPYLSRSYFRYSDDSSVDVRTQWKDSDRYKDSSFFSFDSANTLLQRTTYLDDGSCHVEYYRYDSLKRQVAMVTLYTGALNDCTTERYTYNASGRLARTWVGPEGDPRGNSYTYDEAGRLSRLTVFPLAAYGDSLVVGYRWDGRGRLLEIEDIMPFDYQRFRRTMLPKLSSDTSMGALDSLLRRLDSMALRSLDHRRHYRYADSAGLSYQFEYSFDRQGRDMMIKQATGRDSFGRICERIRYTNGEPSEEYTASYDTAGFLIRETNRIVNNPSLDETVYGYLPDHRLDRVRRSTDGTVHETIDYRYEFD